MIGKGFANRGIQIEGAAELFPARHFVGARINGETFLVIFNAARRDAAIAAVGRWAENPELPAIGWQGAVGLSQAIKRAVVEEEEKGGAECSGI